MKKPINLPSQTFPSKAAAKEFFYENIKKGDEIKKDNAKFHPLFDLFVEYCNESPSPQWHVIPDEISHFRFGPTLVEDGKNIVGENNCFWCVFVTDEVDRKFSIEGALTWKANKNKSTN